MFESFRNLGERDLKALAKSLFEILKNPDQPVDMAGCRAIVSRLHGTSSSFKGTPQDSSPTGLRHLAFAVGPLGGKKPWLLPPLMTTASRLVFGQTGSGRTETLVTMCKPHIDAGHGCIYIDGNGDSGLMSKMMRLATEAGREKDVLVLNLLQGGRRSDRLEGPWWKQGFVGEPRDKRLTEQEAENSWTRHNSHTFNPFESLTLDGARSWLIPWLVKAALADPRMEKAMASNPGAEGRITLLADALFAALIEGRDKGLWPLDARVISKALEGEWYDLTQDNRLAEVTRQTLKQQATDGWDAPDETGMRAIVLTAWQVLGDPLEPMLQHSLWWAHVEGNQWKAADLDWRTALDQKKIIVILAPTLEKSPDAVCSMMAPILGSLQEAMEERLASTQEKPLQESIWVFDQAGYYLTPQVANLAKANGHGVTTVWAASHLTALKTFSPEAAKKVVEACEVRVFMRIHVSSGEEIATRTAFPEGILRGQNLTTLAGDIAGFRPGEAYIATGSTLDRLMMAYHNPPRISDSPNPPPAPLRWTRVLGGI
jgi:hypothetical protein